MKLNFFYNLMISIDKKSNKVIKKNSYRIIIRIVRLLLPLYYIITPKKSGISIRESKDTPKVIVSLTTFPARMDKLWVVIESLLRQKQKPDKIILWLATSQFPNVNDIDKKILKMKKRGLDIRYCEDIKSHKKYYYTMKEHINDIVITVDDDVFYPENLIEDLLNKHYEFPEFVVCNRAHLITFKNGEINEYNDWDYLSSHVSGPDILLMATGVGGVLYPPNSLSEEVFNMKAIKELCPNADDIWLKCMEYIKGTPTVKVSEQSYRLFNTKGSDENGLAILNVQNEENDIQLRNVMDHYNIKFIDND